MDELNFEDYGITESDIQKDKKTYFPESFYGFWGALTIGLIIIIPLTIIVFLQEFHFSSRDFNLISLAPLILLFIPTAILSFFFGSVIALDIEKIDSYFYRKNPTYRAVQRYKDDKYFLEMDKRKLEEEQKRHEYEKALEQKRKERNYWLSMTGKGIKFEREIGELFSKMGYKVKYTSSTGDEGVDIFLTNQNNERIVVQCKAHKKPIGPGPIRDLFGTLHHNNARKAIIVSLSGFSDAAKEFARNKPINLLTVKDLIKLQKKYSTND